jgi:hypothetical protein
MTTISPMPPLGPYPQLLLCPHVGNTPTKAKIRMIRRIVPILIYHLLEIDFPGMQESVPLCAPVDLLSVRWRTQFAAANSLFLDIALC